MGAVRESGEREPETETLQICTVVLFCSSRERCCFFAESLLTGGVVAIPIRPSRRQAVEPLSRDRCMYSSSQHVSVASPVHRYRPFAYTRCAMSPRTACSFLLCFRCCAGADAIRDRRAKHVLHVKYHEVLGAGNMTPAMCDHPPNSPWRAWYLFVYVHTCTVVVGGFGSA